MGIWLWLMGGLMAFAGELGFGYSPTLGPGEQPMFSVTLPRPASSLWVQIEAGGQRWEFTRTQLDAGAVEQFHWTRDPSVSEAEATVRVDFSDGYVEAVVVPVQYSYAGRLSVDLSSAVADLTGRTLTVGVNQPVVQAEVKAIGAHGRVLDQSKVPLDAGPGEITVPWVGDPAEVVLLDVTLHTTNAWSGFTYSPWFVDIPHDDVVFGTGLSEITPDEVPKLVALMSELNELIEKYGRVVPVKLYVGGCTDTMGDAASNRGLSRARAQAIGAWLKGRGLGIPVFYAGFGESWLAVPTGDGVDNALNRRAVYMVGANPPPASASVPAIRWTPL